MLAGSQLQAYFSFTICLYFVWNSLARTHSANRVSQWPHTVQNHRSHSISVSTFELDLFLRPFYLLFIYSRLNSAVSLVQPESLVWLSKLLSVQDESDEETVFWWREEKKIEAKSPRKTYKTLCRATRIQRTRSFHKKMSQNYVQFIIIITISYCFHLGRFQISQRPGGNRTRVMIIGAHFLCAFCSFYSASFRLPWPLAMVHAQWPYDQLILVSLWATCTRAFIQSYIFGIVHFKNEMSRHQFRPSLWLCLCLIFLFSPLRSLIIKNWFTLTWNAPIFDCSVQRESKKYVCVCVFSLLGAGSIHANIVALQTHWCECSHCAPWTMRRVGKTSQHMNDGMNNSSRAQIFEHFYSFFFLSRRRHFDSHRSHSFAPAIVPKQCEIVILIVAFVYFGHCSLGRSGAIDSCTSWNGSLYNSIRAVICEIILSTVFLHPNLHTFCQCGRWIERDRVWEKETRD